MIVFAVFINLFYFPGFSQQNGPVQFIKPILSEDKNPFHLMKDFDFTTILDDSVYNNKKLYIPRIPDKEIHFNQRHVWKSNPSLLYNNCIGSEADGIFQVWEFQRRIQGINDKYPLLIQ